MKEHEAGANEVSTTTR